MADKNHGHHHGHHHGHCAHGHQAGHSHPHAAKSSPTAVAAAPANAADVIYTCPMHPEIRQKGPGYCPKCGMALEPVTPHAQEDDSEVKAVRRKFWIALALAVPVV